MKITIALIEKLIALRDGESMPDSQLNGEWFRLMKEEGILLPIIHGSRRSWKARNAIEFEQYIQDRHSLSNLEQCLRLITSDESSRAEQVAVTGDSKFVSQRTFKGFLVNCYTAIEASIAGIPVTILPTEGTFTFIAEYVQFNIPSDVIIVGIENAENFRYISRQRSFFDKHIGHDAKLLFVSRYPQSQSKDLRSWLLGVKNQYIHFGDLDLAGINIYLSEFYKFLGARSSFLIPEDYEARIKNGSDQRYIDQYNKLGKLVPPDPRLQSLVDCIHHYHRGYDQEGFIK